MSNLSKIRRDKMIEFLETLKEQHSDDESLIAINQIEKELVSKRYGLVWEEHEEAVDVMMRDNIPVFTEVKEREICMVPGEKYNFLIEGDNLHSLKLLEKTHKGKITVIYIDPPYNTGKKDFVYDDMMVALDDGFRHSKWLSFMNDRLLLAKSLLANNGIIFISIDDNEQATLKLLCDSIFGEENFISMLSVENNPKGRKNSSFVSVSNEYCLIYAKNKNSAYFIENIPKPSSDLTQDENGVYIHNSGKRVLVGENSFNKKVENKNSDKHYSVYFNEKIQDMILIKDEGIDKPHEELLKKGYRRYYSYCGNDFVENTYSMSKFEELFSKDALDFKDNKIYEKNFSTTIRIKSLVTNRKYEAIINNKKVEYQIDVKTTSAGSELKCIFNTSKPVFSNPKNVSYIKLLNSLLEDKDITVLDFFAGSGTTAQAVLELNKEDGGQRKFILCTNNENNICEEITYQRVKTVITGKRQDGSEYSEGIPANVKYYHTDFVSKSEEYLADSLLNHVTEMIQLEHGIRIDDDSYIMIMSDDEADELEKKWNEYTDVKAIYVSQDVLLTASQEALFGSVDTYIIPDYYFNFELREAGELW